MKQRHDDFDPELRGLFQAGSPPEPSDADWTATLEGIRRQVNTPRVAAVPVSGRWRRAALIAASFAAAAAIALAIILPSFEFGSGNERPSQTVDAEHAEPYPVTDSEDVEILSVDAADSGAIVVGELPLRKPIVLVEPGDVALRSLERDPDGGEWSEAHLQPEGDPMIWAPLATGSPAGPSKE